MQLKIITDTSADLPEKIINQYKLEVVPLLVTYQDKVYRDGVTLKPLELFDGMRSGKVYKTSQVPVGDFKEVFTRYAREKLECLYIAFSSALSGTYQSAILAREQVLEEYPDFQLEIIDSKCASIGQGLVVYHALQLVQSGMNRAEVIEAVKFQARHMEHIFTVDDLEYLYRGGRVSRTAALVGGLLNIKPILNVEEGKLIPLEKKRGRKLVLKRMIEIMEERGVALSEQLVGISHADDAEGAEVLKGMIKERFGVSDFLINTIGSVIGAHTGPGTLAIYFLNQEYSPK